MRLFRDISKYFAKNNFYLDHYWVKVIKKTEPSTHNKVNDSAY